MCDGDASLLLMRMENGHNAIVHETSRSITLLPEHSYIQIYCKCSLETAISNGILSVSVSYNIPFHYVSGILDLGTAGHQQLADRWRRKGVLTLARIVGRRGDATPNEIFSEMAAEQLGGSR